LSYLTAQISASTSGDNTVIAAPSTINPPTGGAGSSYTPSIIVHGYLIVAAGSVVARFYNGASASTLPLTGPMSMITGTPIAFGDPSTLSGRSQPFAFKLSAGSALVLNLGAGVQVSGHIIYSIL